MHEVVEALAKDFELTDFERRQPLSVSQQPIFDNRVGWARTYLKKAGLLESPRRGCVKITKQGVGLLKENPKAIDTKMLRKFPGFIEFQTAKKVAEPEREEAGSKTPREQMETGYQNIKRDVETELLSIIKSCSPVFFERLVVELLVVMGYGGSVPDAGQAIGRTGDEGIDGIIKEDKLGLDLVYIQAKRWEKTVVGRPEIQKFVGSLHGQRARKGVFITTSTFSQEASDYVGKIEDKIVLIDGVKLAQLMIDNNVGVSLDAKYEIKKIDSDYFVEE